MSSTTSSRCSYPVRVDAQLDDHLSRWLWLVKWLLAIPHFVVLALLWVAFAVLSVVAFFAILITGRYPRSHLRLQRRGAALELAGRPTTPTAGWAPTTTRPSASRSIPTTPPTWRSPTPSTCRGDWCS